MNELRSVIQKNKIFIGILALWFACAFLAPSALYVVLPATALYMFYSNMYIEILVGFLYFGVMSDMQGGAVVSNFKQIYLVFMAATLLNMKRFAPFPTVHLNLVPFFLIALITTFLSSQMLTQSLLKIFSSLMSMIAIPAYFLRAYRINKNETLQKMVYLIFIIILLGFVGGSLVAQGDTITGGYKGDELSEAFSGSGRYSGIFRNPNALALFSFLYLCVITVIFEYHPHLFPRTHRYFIFGLTLVSLVATRARGGIFAFVIFYLFAKITKKSPILAIVTIILSITLYQLLGDFVIDVIDKLNLAEFLRTNQEDTKKGSGRLIAFQHVWEFIKERPFLGYGIDGTDKYIFGPKYQNDLLTAGHVGNAHNSFLTFWADTGILGVLFWILGMFTNMFRGARFTPYAIPFMGAVIFTGMVESWLTGTLGPYIIMFYVNLSILTEVSFTEVEEIDFQDQDGFEPSENNEPDAQPAQIETIKPRFA